MALMLDKRSTARPNLQELRYLYKEYQPTEPQFKDTTFSTVAFAYSGQRSVASYQLTAIQELADKPLNQALNFTSSGNPAQLVQWIANCKAKEAFALAKGDESRASKRREAVERVEQVITDITGKEFRFNMDDDPLKVTAAIDGQEVELDVLPDGLKSIISWIADLLMRMDRIRWADETPVLKRPFLLFLDEIEVHLHPAWQRKVLPTVQGLFPNAQVFISTHSPFIIASADDAWIYPLHEGENGSGTIVDKALPSMAGNSYATVLRDALGIDAEFAPQVEEQLNAFYELRDAVLAGSAQAETLRSKGEELRSLGEEVAAIVTPELRQVERRLASQPEGGDA
jgi:predicted ATP-binding protein involved in virulence